MRTIRRLVVAMLLTVASFVPHASATSFSTDQGDVWSVQGENGWGFLSAQRGSAIFGAIYVYDPTNIPIWYSGTLEYAGNLVWTGDLFLTNGPWFGTVPFNSGAVTYRKVGAITWTATSVTTGELKYSVDGVLVTKEMSRLLLRFDDFSGHFAGGIHETTSGCANSGFNGTNEDVGILNITQSGQSFSMTSLPTGGGSCAYTGTLTQAGQMGAATGTFACSSGATGTFQLYEMQVNPVSVSGQFTSNSSIPTGCQSSGWFGGLKVTTF